MPKFTREVLVNIAAGVILYDKISTFESSLPPATAFSVFSVDSDLPVDSLTDLREAGRKEESSSFNTSALISEDLRDARLTPHRIQSKEPTSAQKWMKDQIVFHYM